MKPNAFFKNIIFLISLNAIFPISYASSQAELLNAQDNYQSTRNQFEDAKTKLNEAKKELADAKKALVAAQDDLKLKQKNLATAEVNVKNTGIAFTAATTKINSVWDGSASTKTAPAAKNSDN